MCGIFGIVSKKKIDKHDFKTLALLSRERGKDSSGFLNYDLQNNDYFVRKFDKDIKDVLSQVLPKIDNLAIGHSRLITNSTPDNQPVLIDNMACIHNGIIINFRSLFLRYKINQKIDIDSEILPALVNYYIKEGYNLDQVINKILVNCEGIINCAIAIPKLGKMLLFSNNGSLYIGRKKENYYFASEKYFLKQIYCNNICQVTKEIIDIPKINKAIIEINESNKIKRDDFVPTLQKESKLKKLLIYDKHQMQRCSKCILPSSMPFIKFDDEGICNYCKNYKKKNFVKYDSHKAYYIFNNYRITKKHADCIIPLS